MLLLWGDTIHLVAPGYLCGVLYSALGKYSGPSSPRARANAARVLRELADAASDKGITLALEYVNRYETNLLNTARDTRAFIAEDMGDPKNVFVHLDSYHAHIEENSMREAVLACGDRLGYVHIGECHRGYLGQGSCDLPGLFRALRDVDYNGPITFESFSSAVVSDDLSNTLAVWRNLWDDSDDLASHAHAYMQAQLILNSKH